MIQEIGRFSAKWGSVLIIGLSVLFMIITFILQLQGVEEYEYYESRFHEAVSVPLAYNYCISVFFILCAFKKEWLWPVKRKIKRYFTGRK